MAEEYAIAMDIGTSGIRAQAINVEDNSTISTTVTLRHPIPGANVMDHLHFAVNVGGDQNKTFDWNYNCRYSNDDCVANH